MAERRVGVLLVLAAVATTIVVVALAQDDRDDGDAGNGETPREAFLRMLGEVNLVVRSE